MVRIDANEPFADNTGLVKLLGDHPRVKILAALISENDSEIQISDLCNQAGLHRSTIAPELEELHRMGIVKLPDEEKVRINRDSEAAEKLAELEWKAIDAAEGLKP